jgi:uncharacterized protein (TIGR04206 family)
MPWVRSEYAGELAVLSGFASVLLPWSASYTAGGGLSIFVIRFPFFLFQFIYGASFGAAERPFLLVHDAWDFPGREIIQQAYLVWLAGAVVLLLALLLAVVYYLREERVEAARIDPVRVMGALLLVGGGALLVSAAMLVLEFAGLTIPIGALLVPVLGVVLLRVDRA